MTNLRITLEIDGKKYGARVEVPTPVPTYLTEKELLKLHLTEMINATVDNIYEEEEEE